MASSAQPVKPLEHRFADAPDDVRNSKFFHEFLSRLTGNRDMHVIITAAAETGVGKTTLAVSLALWMDPHGWTADKATLDPREYEMLYEHVPEGSVLVLDEVQQAADARRGTSRDNVDLSQAFAQNRYRQIFGIMTAPKKGWVDGRIGEDSADYWIQAQETERGRAKGEAIVYRLRNNEHYNTSYSERTEIIRWPRLDGHDEFQDLHEKKVERRQGRRESAYVHRSEYEALRENYWNKCMKKTRFHLVRAMVSSGMTQTEITEVLGDAETRSNGEVEALSQPRVSQLANAESFSEVYSG